MKKIKYKLYIKVEIKQIINPLKPIKYTFKHRDKLIAGIYRDKTIDDKLMYIRNHDNGR